MSFTSATKADDLIFGWYSQLLFLFVAWICFYGQNTWFPYKLNNSRLQIKTWIIWYKKLYPVESISLSYHVRLCKQARHERVSFILFFLSSPLSTASIFGKMFLDSMRCSKTKSVSSHVRALASFVCRFLIGTERFIIGWRINWLLLW